MITLFRTIEPLELLFIIGVAGTVLTFPLNDILSLWASTISLIFSGHFDGESARQCAAKIG